VNGLKYKRDTIIIRLQSYIKAQKYDDEIGSNRGDSKARKGRRTVPITHGKGAREIKKAL